MNLLRRMAHGHRPVILMYHRVARVESDPFGLVVHPERFSEQIEIFSRHRQVVPLLSLESAMQSWRSGQRPLGVVTFDDGYADVLQNAVPILEAYDVPATLFVPVCILDDERDFWWDRASDLIMVRSLQNDIALAEPQTGTTINLPGSASSTERMKVLAQLCDLLTEMNESAREAVLDALAKSVHEVAQRQPMHPHLSAAEVASLSRDVLEIGLHAVSHSIFPRLSTEAKNHEVSNGRRRLEEIVSYPIESFAFPHGRYDEASIAAVEAAGMKVACTTDKGTVKAKHFPYRLPRMKVENWDADAFERALLTDPF